MLLLQWESLELVNLQNMGCGRQKTLAVVLQKQVLLL